MARKNLLTGLTDRMLTAVNSDETVAGVTGKPSSVVFSGRGAFGAVTRTIDDLAARADAAKELDARLKSGEVVVNLDPALIDGSFVTDRMEENDENYRTLLQGIGAKGQDTPILVRPHPTVAGRFQVAFGHRRLRAAVELKRPVRALVRDLSDRDLVLAQGQENSNRADLSFIERARFARSLEDAGYDRETIMSALSVDKTTVSRMISVVRRIPQQVISLIGPAPATGRDRWIKLSSLFEAEASNSVLEQLPGRTDFIASPSDHRFEMVLTLLCHPPEEGDGRQNAAARGRLRARGRTRYWSPKGVSNLAKITANDEAFVLAIDRQLAPGFDDYLVTRLDDVYAAFKKNRRGN